MSGAAERRLTARAAAILGGAAPAAEDGFAADLWAALEEGGVLAAGMPQAAGGEEQGLGTLLALTRVAAAHAAPLPVAETLLGQYVLAQAGLAPPIGPLTVGPVLRADAAGFADGALSGRLRRVPWARHATAAVVVVAGPAGVRTVLAGRPEVAEHGLNPAGEPRDLVALEETPVLAAGPPGEGLSPLDLYRLGALFQAAAMAGALEAAADLALRAVRGEDGTAPVRRPTLARDIVRLAAESLMARTAAEVAGRAATPFAIACARLRVSQAAGTGAVLAHRILGPASLASDHPLAALTRRLWSWREEFGSEAEWATWLGRQAREAGGEKLWALIADQDRREPAPDGAPGA